MDVVSDKNLALKRIAKPGFKRSHTLHEDLVIIESIVPNVLLNRPIYIGFSVLDLSKLLMSQFHYDKMRVWFDDINLCFTDTGEKNAFEVGVIAIDE